MFEKSLLDYSESGKTNKRFTVAFSLLLQTIAVGIMIVMPLMYAEALPTIHLMTLLMTPPPPPVAQPPNTTIHVQVKLKAKERSQKMVEPQVMPEHASII